MCGGEIIQISEAKFSLKYKKKTTTKKKLTTQINGKFDDVTRAVENR
jgi:hypothetical protein